MKKWYYDKFENKKMIISHILATIIIGEFISILFPLKAFKITNISFILLGFPFLSWPTLPFSLAVNLGIPNNTLLDFILFSYWPVLIFLVVKMFKKKEKIFFIIFSIIYIFSCYGVGAIMKEWTKF